LRLLISEQARDFLNAVTFWDAKRPITVDVLSRLNLHALARERGEELNIGNSLLRTA
jgi:hypothetical protein